MYYVTVQNNFSKSKSAELVPVFSKLSKDSTNSLFNSGLFI